MKGIILYEGKYGATQQYARWLGEELRLPVYHPHNLSDTELATYDFILLGSPVYMGRLLVHKWLTQRSGILQSKKIFLFVVCASTCSDIEQQRELVKKNVPEQLLYRCSISFLRGRLLIKNLSWRDKLLLKMGAWLQKNPKKKKAMLTDFNAVKKDNIAPLLVAVNSYLAPKTKSERQNYIDAMQDA